MHHYTDNTNLLLLQLLIKINQQIYKPWPMVNSSMALSNLLEPK